MKNNTTEMVFILDKSGSMFGLEKDTIGGFNSLIEKQKNVDGKCFVSTVLFNNRSQVLHDRISLDKVPQMTERDYCTNGSTALLDAVGGAIKHIGNIHKYARREDVPEKTMFVIITDGMENASHLYTPYEVKQMIERQKSKYDWEFLFIGANIDAALEAEKIGIDSDRAVNYTATPEGTSSLYNAVAKNVSYYRENACVAAGWADEIK